MEEGILDQQKLLNRVQVLINEEMLRRSRIVSEPQEVIVHMRGRDTVQFFALAVVANVISSMVVMGTVGYLAKKDRKNKENKENDDRSGN